MNLGCLFGPLVMLLGGDPKQKHDLPRALVDEEDMGEGEIHSGPGGYEGMGYTDGYAADYFDHDEGDER